MKKLISLLLALLMTAALPMSAMAGGVLDGSTVTERSVYIGKDSNTYIMYRDRQYYLCDANGNWLTSGYSDMSYQNSGALVAFSTNTGINDEGLMEAATGKVLVPASYGDTYYVNNDWTMGIYLVSTTDEEGDYKAWDSGDRFNIDYVDVFYKGAKITTLTRSEYRGSYFSAYAGYLCVRQESTKAIWFDSQGNRTEVTDDSYVSTSEYEDQYRKGVFHNATQQYAFTPGCTLTADQVVRSVWYNDDGNFIDLQGNIISKGPSAYKEYDSVGYYGGDYMYIRANSKYGVVDMQGNEILPAVYTHMSTNTSGYFAVGYQAVLDEAGKLSYLDKSGNVVSSVDFTMSESDYKGFSNNAPIIVVKNLGSFMIITATKGLLPETYEDAYTVNSATQRLISVKKNGLWGCIDMNGDTIIPFTHASSLDISADGTLVSGRVKDGDYMLYNIHYTDDVPAAPALAEGEWQSACGTVASTNFCPDCGEKKPVDSCSNCGYTPDGDTPKFCPDCGTKF